MNTFLSNDSIEQLIYDSGLRITSVAFFKKQDMIFVFLNTGISLSFPISSYKSLSIANEEQLTNYKLIAGGIGIHWPDIDEDLSLKGFLKEELKKLTGLNDKNPDGTTKKYAMAA